MTDEVKARALRKRVTAAIAVASIWAAINWAAAWTESRSDAAILGILMAVVAFLCPIFDED